MATLLTSTAMGCSPRELPAPTNAVPVAARCGSTVDSRFFPADSFRWLPQDGRVWRTWPAEILDSMHELPLSCGAQPDSYRILWIAALAEWPPDGVSAFPPTMVRVSRHSDGWIVTAVQLANSVSQKELKRSERLLTEEESVYMLAAVSGFGLWTQRDFALNADAHDGALWVVEGRRGQGYHPVFLANVDQKAVRALALVFFDLAGIKLSVAITGIVTN